MSKPVLGRGLGSLLGADKIAGKPNPTAIVTPVPTPQPAPGRGVGTLLKGTLTPVPATVEAAAPALVPKAPISSRPKLKFVPPHEVRLSSAMKLESKPVTSMTPQWRYLGADMVLLLVAGLVVSSRSSPLDWTQVLLLAILIGTGAALACWPMMEALKKSSSGSGGVVSRWVLAHGPNPGECFVVHLHEPNFVARVDEAGGKKVVVPMSPVVWLKIPRRVSDRLKREALAFFESERTKPDTIHF